MPLFYPLDPGSAHTTEVFPNSGRSSDSPALPATFPFKNANSGTWKPAGFPSLWRQGRERGHSGGSVPVF